MQMKRYQNNTLMNVLAVQTCIRTNAQSSFSIVNGHLQPCEHEYETKLVMNKLLSNCNSRTLEDTQLVVFHQPKGSGTNYFISQLQWNINQIMTNVVYIHLDFNRLKLKDRDLDEQVAWYIKRCITIQCTNLNSTVQQELTSSYSVREIIEALIRNHSRTNESYLFHIDGLDFVNNDKNRTKQVHPYWNSDRKDKASNRERTRIFWDLFSDYLYGQTSIFFIFSDPIPNLFIMAGKTSSSVVLPPQFYPINIELYNVSSLVKSLNGTHVTCSSGTAKIITVLFALGLSKVHVNQFASYIIKYTAGVPDLATSVIKHLLHEKPDLSNPAMFKSIIQSAAVVVKPEECYHAVQDPMSFLKLLGLAFLGIPQRIDVCSL
jgi:hypothetical protein